MSSLEAHLSRLIDGVPEGGAVTLPREAVERWLEEAGVDPSERPLEGRGEPVADLTVREIAEAHGKGESTVRGWLEDVPGTYRLGQEIRISREDWRDYLTWLAENDEDDGPPEVRSRPGTELSDWRKTA